MPLLKVSWRGEAAKTPGAGHARCKRAAGWRALYPHRDGVQAVIVAVALGLATSASARAAPAGTCPAPDRSNALTATFLGASSILLDDGDRQVLIDGFFSRPSPLSWPFNLHPDAKRIDPVMAAARICRLDAILVAHAHHDHVLDAPDIVAGQSHAVLAGSRSVGAVARGRGLAEDQILQLEDGDTLVCGRFQILAIATRHPPGLLRGFLPGGEVRAPVARDAGVWAYKAGGNLAFFVQHERGVNTLIVPSADTEIIVPEHVKAETVMLSVGLLGFRNERETRQYWTRAVVETQAARVALIHWDNLSGSLAKPLKLAPRPFDQVRRALSRIDAMKGPVQVVRLDAFDQMRLSPADQGGPAADRAAEPSRAQRCWVKARLTKQKNSR